MINNFKLKKVSYSDKLVNTDILYRIFAEIIIEDVKKNERIKKSSKNIRK